MEGLFFAFAFIVYLLVPLAIVSFIALLVARRVVRDVKNEVVLLRSRVAGLEARVPSPPESPGIEDAAAAVARSAGSPLEPAHVAPAPARAPVVAPAAPASPAPPARPAVPARPASTAGPAGTAPIAGRSTESQKPGDLLGRWSAQVSQRATEAGEWEAVIGGRWLNKIGVVVLVIGVALFLAYSLRHMGPAGRVATGAATALALLLGGVWIERRRDYAVFARPLIGGGWALLYFTAYAAHNVEAAKIIDDPALAMPILAIIAGGMIVHSVRYRSEVVTALAYFLGFLTVAISPLTGFSLVASVLLAASLLVVLRQTRWYWLGLFGLVATYVTHAMWLEVRMDGFANLSSREPFWLGQGMLVLYWLVFTGFDFILRPERADERRASVGINLANTLCFLGLSARQVWAVFPESRYLLAALGGVAYVATSVLLYARDRRWLSRVNAIVAATLVAASVFLRWSGTAAEAWLAPAWLVEGAIVFALGLRLREVAFRAWSYLAVGAAVIALLQINLPAAAELSATLRWVTVTGSVACLYALFAWLHRQAARGVISAREGRIGVIASYVAALVFALLVMREVPAGWVGVAWLAAGLLSLESGIRFTREPLRIEGYALIAAAVAANLCVNLYGILPYHETVELSRWVGVGPAIALLYAAFARLRRWASAHEPADYERRAVTATSFAATLLLAILLWKELDSVAVALAWGVLGLLLYELAARVDVPPLRGQAHALAWAAVGRLFLANFTASGEIAGVSDRLVTVVPIVAILYYLRSRIAEEVAAGRARFFETRLPRLYSFAAAVLLVTLARFEFGSAHTVVAWAALALGFLAVGVFGRDPDFRLQSYLLVALTFWRSWTTNFYLTGSFFGLPERIGTTLPVIAAFYAGTVLCLVKREVFFAAEPSSATEALDANAKSIYSLAGNLLLTLLLYYEVQGNLLTIAWALEGFALLALGFVIRERMFRLSGLALLLVCLVKVFAIDLRDVETLYRIFSFIVLGIILLAVSFVYTRYRDLLRRYL